MFNENLNEPEKPRQFTSRIYAIYDSKAMAYLQPFFASGDEVAVRSFERAALNPEHTMHTHPGDFTLFRIGDWSEYDGHIEIQVPVYSVINGLHLTMWNEKANDV